MLTRSAPLTVDTIHAALQRWVGDEYLYLPEFRMGTGYRHRDNERRIDALALPLYPHRAKRGTMGFEIKLSRSDYAREMRDPSKLRAAWLQSSEFYFVTPLGLLAPAELPLEAGLIEITGDGKAVSTLTAFHRQAIVTEALVAALCRRMKGVEE